MTHEITADLVRELLHDQHPDLADRPLRPGARGWDNQLWRLGDDLAVRLPWATAAADALLRKEHRWVHAAPAPAPYFTEIVANWAPKATLSLKQARGAARGGNAALRRVGADVPARPGP